MLGDIISFGISFSTRDARRELERALEIVPVEAFVDLHLSDFHVTSLELQLMNGSYINPATNLFGGLNSYGIKNPSLKNYEMTFEIPKLEVYGINSAVIPYMGLGAGMGTLVGSVTAIVLGSTVMGPVSLVLAPLAIMYSLFMMSSQKLKEEEQNRKIGFDITTMLAHTTNLNAMQVLIKEGVINEINEKEFNDAVDIVKIQKSFSDNVGNRDYDHQLNSLECYLSQLENLDRLITEKRGQKEDFTKVFESKLAKLKKPMHKFFETLTHDKSGSEALVNVGDRINQLFIKPVAYRISGGEINKGKTVILQDLNFDLSKEQYININNPKEELCFYGPLSSSVTEMNRRLVDYSAYCEQESSFSEEIKDIPVAGRIKIKGYTGVSIIKTSLSELYKLGAIQTFYTSSVSLRINDRKDIVSTFQDRKGNKVEVSNAIKTESTEVSFSLSERPEHEVRDLISLYNHRYENKYLRDLYNYLYSVGKYPTSYFERLDRYPNIPLFSLTDIREGDKIYLVFTLGLPAHFRYLDSYSVMSLEEAMFLNDYNGVQPHEYVKAQTPEVLHLKTGIPLTKIEVTELVEYHWIRVHEVGSMAEMTGTFPKYFDYNACFIRPKGSEFLGLIRLDEIRGSFAGQAEKTPNFNTAIIMGEERAWIFLD